MSDDSDKMPFDQEEILIVDDNPENLKVLGDFFDELGYQVRVARDGKQALENALAAPPAIILLDIHMPVMDGYEACTRIKASETLSDIPVIFLSALGETFNKVRAFECGGSDYITKPFQLQEVKARIETQLLARQALVETRSSFRAGFYQAAVGMAHLSPEGVIIEGNENFRSMFGVEKAVLLGTNLLDCVHPSCREQLERVFVEAQATDFEGKPAEYLFLSQNNREVWIRAAFSRIALAKGRYQLSAVLDDITAHKEVLSERRQLAAALEQVGEAIAILSLDGVVTYVNTAFSKVFGVVEADVTQRLLPILDPESDSNSDIATVWASLEHGDSWCGRLTRNAPGGKSRTEEYLLSPIRDETGYVTNYVAVCRDLSRQIRLEEQLRQSQKMEAIGTLAAGIAHDFNNILAAIVGFTQLSMEALPEEHECRADLQEVLSAASHATELVRQILAFARRSPMEIQAIRIQDVTDEALKLLRRSIPSTVHFEVRLDSDCSSVMADPTAIHQVIMNLCTNAYHAMEENGGTLTVHLSERTLGEEAVQSGIQLPPGAYVRLDIGDTGCGMEKETAARIFEPYFTTKEYGSGTGLGLATVHGIISDLHGAIYVYSEPGNGSTFSVFFPVASVDTSTSQQSSEKTVSREGTERILFVDDERAICQLAEKALNRLGYHVIVRTDPLEALALFEETPQEFDVVVTDEMMPEMRGTDLLLKLRAVRPEVPVILYSGFAESLRNKPRTNFPFNAYVMKPMVIAELTEAIRSVMAEVVN